MWEGQSCWKWKHRDEKLSSQGSGECGLELRWSEFTGAEDNRKGHFATCLVRLSGETKNREQSQGRRGGG